MAAPKGNQFAKGNRGGGNFPKEYREKQRLLRQKAIDQALEIMDNGSQEARWEIIMKILPSCLPKEIEADIGGEFVVKVVKFDEA